MTPPPGRLVFVRHGESEWNAAKRWQGHGGSGLTPRGAAQAEATAGRIAEEFTDVAIIVRSDLQRVAETAEPLTTRLDVPVRVDARLRELDVGAWSGLTHDEIAAVDPRRYEAWARGDDIAPGGGERVRDLQERVMAALLELLAALGGATAVVVTHGGPIRVGVAGLLGRQVTVLDDGYAPVGNGSLSVVTATGRTARLDAYGDCRHLDLAGSARAKGSR